MRSILNKHNEQMKTFRSRLATIEKEGEGRPQWKLEQRKAALANAKSVHLGIKAELRLHQAKEEEVKRESFLNGWKGLAHRTFKHVPSESLYWQNHAAAAFSGKTSEQAREAYDYQVKNMNERERVLYRHILDQHLKMHVFGDATEGLAAEKTINEKRSPEERELRHNLLKAERISDYIPTLTGIFEANFEHAEAGEKPANDPLNVLDEIEKDTAAEFGEGVY